MNMKRTKSKKTKPKYLPKKKKKETRGRHLFDGKDKEIVLSKLMFAFDIDATDEEAAACAGISVEALYRYQQKNPEFRQEKARRKQNTVLLARAAVADSLLDAKKKTGVAMWLLEKKRPDEYAGRTNVTLGQDKDRPFTGLLDAIKHATKELGLPSPINITPHGKDEA